MSKYTTGEIAKLCGVSVRTVQYYDSRNILIPSNLSEGGRRLYSEDDLKKMQIICCLRNMGFSIDNIAELLSDRSSEKIIAMLISEQERTLLAELKDNKEKLEKLNDMKRIIESFGNFSVNSLGDVAHIMKNQKKRNKIIRWMFIVGLFMDLIEVGTVLYGIKTGIWWPLILGLPIVIALGIYISYFYYKNVYYICPECHEVFKPSFKEMFCAAHTPKTRKLKCPKCGHKGYCVETCKEDNME